MQCLVCDKEGYALLIAPGKSIYLCLDCMEKVKRDLAKRIVWIKFADKVRKVDVKI